MEIFIVSIRVVLLVGAFVLSAFEVFNQRGKSSLGWAVLFLSVALLLR